MFVIRRLANILCRSFQLYVVLYKYSIKINSHSGRAQQTSIVVKPGCFPGNIIRLPLARREVCIYQGSKLFIYTSGLSVYVGSVIIVIEDLQFVSIITLSDRSKEEAT